MAVKLGNIIFLGHARMASTAISEMLIRAGGERIGPNHEPWFGEGYKFCVIRNPLDVLATWFVLNPQWKDMSSFLQNYNHRAMRRNGRLFYLVQYCDDYILYDHLEEELLIKYGATLNLERVGVTPGKMDYHHYFSPENVALARLIYRKDFALYEEN